MSLSSVVHYVAFLGVVVVLAKPVGGYLFSVFTGHKTFMDFALCPVERIIYRIAGIDADRQMNARQYSVAFVLFSLAGP